MKNRPKRRKRPPTYNSNFAREQQRKELRSLRTEAKDLESQLAVIQQVRQGLGGQNNSISDRTERSPLADIARGVWMTLAQQQFAQRITATKENERLKSLVARNFDVISKLQELLQQCSIDQTMRSMHPDAAASLRVYDSEILTKSDLDQLIASADNSYQQVDNIFSQCSVNLADPSIQTAPEMLVDGAGRFFSRVFGSKIFPFSLNRTGPVVWNVLSGRVRPFARCHFSHVSYIVENTDTIVESCGTELYTEDAKAVLFHTRQMKRRYQGQSRDVIVWQSDVRPVQFGGRRLQGAAFKEIGVFLTHHHPLIPSEFTLLQTCYVITPCTPMSELPKDPLAREVTDFVLKCMAASIPENHRIVDNALIDKVFP
ncbi:M96 mating-specific protein [Phytophthora megakarya]|uniref:M96 mating-specific protein n=1 Tax=Phytophthora megakarya TaxID=4795 RepID=A0A225VSH3_9STRA|nr:M96 mating-specific protein [Phytophthora megakarya]